MLDLSAGGSRRVLLGVEQLGWLTVERESRVGGLVMVCVDVVPE